MLKTRKRIQNKKKKMLKKQKTIMKKINELQQLNKIPLTLKKYLKNLKIKKKKK